MSTGDPNLDGLVASLVGSTEGAMSQEDLVERLAQIYYLLNDPIIIKLVKDNSGKLEKLWPALSPLLRTGRCDDKASLTLKKLRWRLACRRAILIDSEDGGDMPEFRAWVSFGEGVIEDMYMGWRGKLATERIRTYKIEGGSVKKGIMARLFGK
jgi:hypothetical protein